MKFREYWPTKLLHISENYKKIAFFVCFFSSTISPAVANDKADFKSNYSATIRNAESALSFSLNRGKTQAIFKRKNQKNISSYNIDFSGDTLATTGTFHDYKISFDNNIFNLGIVYGEAERSAQLNSSLRGSSAALFNNATLTSSSIIKSKTIGLFSKLIESRRARASSNFTLRAQVHAAQMTNRTSIIAGILSSESEITEKFKTYEVGYAQQFTLDLSDRGKLAMNFSRDSTILQNNLSSKNYGASIGYTFQLQKSGRLSQIEQFPEHKRAFRLSVLDGVGTGSGTFSNNPDQYTGVSHYSAIIPVEPRGISISKIINKGHYRQHYGFAYKKSKTDLSTLGLSNSFGAGNFYKSKYTATVTRNLIIYGHEWDLTDTTFILIGASAGIMKIDTKDQTDSKGVTSITSRGTTVPVGSLIIGVGTRYKINDHVNGFVETRVDYMDGKPFSVPHRLVEVTTLLGLEYGF